MKNLFSMFSGMFLGSDEGRIDAEELKALMEKKEDITLIDVRTPAEFKSGFIPGSVLIPLNTIGSAKVPAKGKVVLYCAAGVRSLNARSILMSRGVKDVVDLKGGIKAWARSGGDIVRT